MSKSDIFSTMGDEAEELRDKIEQLESDKKHLMERILDLERKLEEERTQNKIRQELDEDRSCCGKDTCG